MYFTKYLVLIKFHARHIRIKLDLMGLQKKKIEMTISNDMLIKEWSSFMTKMFFLLFSKFVLF
jgi:hypothetical protein